ncbi:uncharacterized protein LOC106092189 [Stomoxys calcitrans]|uniref:uncharacterized protein LOC106092189 n=1 Tax=Stomoxys calcitrans TaxID=35570 RepID=UPI0027E2F374|nr:uncharacterized protein LOC106092189 [Stomoxys calcitrans]
MDKNQTMDDDLDIYDDLDQFQEQQEQKCKELQNAENRYQESLKTIKNLEEENKTLRKKLQRIELSFQSLLDTARSEIKRKDAEIERLRKEKDDICFRRKIANRSKDFEPTTSSQKIVKNPFANRTSAQEDCNELSKVENKKEIESTVPDRGRQRERNFADKYPDRQHNTSGESYYNDKSKRHKDSGIPETDDKYQYERSRDRHPQDSKREQRRELVVRTHNDHRRRDRDADKHIDEKYEQRRERESERDRHHRDRHRSRNDQSYHSFSSKSAERIRSPDSKSLHNTERQEKDDHGRASYTTKNSSTDHSYSTGKKDKHIGEQREHLSKTSNMNTPAKEKTKLSTFHTDSILINRKDEQCQDESKIEEEEKIKGIEGHKTKKIQSKYGDDKQLTNEEHKSHQHSFVKNSDIKCSGNNNNDAYGYTHKPKESSKDCIMSSRGTQSVADLLYDEFEDTSIEQSYDNTKAQDINELLYENLNNDNLTNVKSSQNLLTKHHTPKSVVLFEALFGPSPSSVDTSDNNSPVTPTAKDALPEAISSREEHNDLDEDFIAYPEKSVDVMNKTELGKCFVENTASLPSIGTIDLTDELFGSDVDTLSSLQSNAKAINEGTCGDDGGSSKKSASPSSYFTNIRIPGLDLISDKMEENSGEGTHFLSFFNSNVVSNLEDKEVHAMNVRETTSQETEGDGKTKDAKNEHTAMERNSEENENTLTSVEDDCTKTNIAREGSPTLLSDKNVHNIPCLDLTSPRSNSLGQNSKPKTSCLSKTAEALNASKVENDIVAKEIPRLSPLNDAEIRGTLSQQLLPILSATSQDIVNQKVSLNEKTLHTVLQTEKIVSSIPNEEQSEHNCITDDSLSTAEIPTSQEFVVHVSTVPHIDTDEKPKNSESVASSILTTQPGLPCLKSPSRLSSSTLGMFSLLSPRAANHIPCLDLTSSPETITSPLKSVATPEKIITAKNQNSNCISVGSIFTSNKEISRSLDSDGAQLAVKTKKSTENLAKSEAKLGKLKNVQPNTSTVLTKKPELQTAFSDQSRSLHGDDAHLADEAKTSTEDLANDQSEAILEKLKNVESNTSTNLRKQPYLQAAFSDQSFSSPSRQSPSLEHDAGNLSSPKARIGIPCLDLTSSPDGTIHIPNALDSRSNSLEGSDKSIHTTKTYKTHFPDSVLIAKTSDMLPPASPSMSPLRNVGANHIENILFSPQAEATPASLDLTSPESIKSLKGIENAYKSLEIGVPKTADILSPASPSLSPLKNVEIYHLEKPLASPKTMATTACLDLTSPESSKSLKGIESTNKCLKIIVPKTADILSPASPSMSPLQNVEIYHLEKPLASPKTMVTTASLEIAHKSLEIIESSSPYESSANAQNKCSLQNEVKISDINANNSKGLKSMHKIDGSASNSAGSTRNQVISSSRETLSSGLAILNVSPKIPVYTLSESPTDLPLIRKSSPNLSDIKSISNAESFLTEVNEEVNDDGENGAENEEVSNTPDFSHKNVSNFPDQQKITSQQDHATEDGQAGKVVTMDIKNCIEFDKLDSNVLEFKEISKTKNDAGLEVTNKPPENVTDTENQNLVPSEKDQANSIVRKNNKGDKKHSLESYSLNASTVEAQCANEAESSLDLCTTKSSFAKPTESINDTNGEVEVEFSPADIKERDFSHTKGFENFDSISNTSSIQTAITEFESVKDNNSIKLCEDATKVAATNKEFIYETKLSDANEDEAKSSTGYYSLKVSDDDDDDAINITNSSTSNIGAVVINTQNHHSPTTETMVATLLDAGTSEISGKDSDSDELVISEEVLKNSQTKDYEKDLQKSTITNLHDEGNGKHALAMPETRNKNINESKAKCLTTLSDVVVAALEISEKDSDSDELVISEEVLKDSQSKEYDKEMENSKSKNSLKEGGGKLLENTDIKEKAKEYEKNEQTSNSLTSLKSNVKELPENTQVNNASLNNNLGNSSETKENLLNLSNSMPEEKVKTFVKEIKSNKKPNSLQDKAETQRMLAKEFHNGKNPTMTHLSTLQTLDSKSTFVNTQQNKTPTHILRLQEDYLNVIQKPNIHEDTTTTTTGSNNENSKVVSKPQPEPANISKDIDANNTEPKPPSGQYTNSLKSLNLIDSYNKPSSLPSVAINSPTPSNFSGIFSKNFFDSYEETIKNKRKSPKSKEYILPAASVLCTINNLKNATKKKPTGIINKKLHWELLDNKNDMLEVEDDSDADSTDEDKEENIKQIDLKPLANESNILKALKCLNPAFGKPIMIARRYTIDTLPLDEAVPQCQPREEQQKLNPLSKSLLNLKEQSCAEDLNPCESVTTSKKLKKTKKPPQSSTESTMVKKKQTLKSPPLKGQGKIIKQKAKPKTNAKKTLQIKKSKQVLEQKTKANTTIEHQYSTSLQSNNNNMHLSSLLKVSSTVRGNLPKIDLIQVQDFQELLHKDKNSNQSSVEIGYHTSPNEIPMKQLPVNDHREEQQISTQHQVHHNDDITNVNSPSNIENKMSNSPHALVCLEDPVSEESENSGNDSNDNALKIKDSVEGQATEDCTAKSVNTTFNTPPKKLKDDDDQPGASTTTELEESFPKESESPNVVSPVYNKQNSSDEQNSSWAENSEPECNKYLKEDEITSTKQTDSPSKGKEQAKEDNKKHKLDDVEASTTKLIKNSLTKDNNKINKVPDSKKSMVNQKKVEVSLEDIGVNLQPFKANLSSFRIPKIKKNIEGETTATASNAHSPSKGNTMGCKQEQPSTSAVVKDEIGRVQKEQKLEAASIKVRRKSVNTHRRTRDPSSEYEFRGDNRIDNRSSPSAYNKTKSLNLNENENIKDNDVGISEKAIYEVEKSELLTHACLPNDNVKQPMRRKSLYAEKIDVESSVKRDKPLKARRKSMYVESKAFSEPTMENKLSNPEKMQPTKSRRKSMYVEDKSITKANSTCPDKLSNVQNGINAEKSMTLEKPDPFMKEKPKKMRRKSMYAEAPHISTEDNEQYEDTIPLQQLIIHRKSMVTARESMGKTNQLTASNKTEIEDGPYSSTPKSKQKFSSRDPRDKPKLELTHLSSQIGMDSKTEIPNKLKKSELPLNVNKTLRCRSKSMYCEKIANELQTDVKEMDQPVVHNKDNNNQLVTDTSNIRVCDKTTANSQQRILDSSGNTTPTSSITPIAPVIETLATNANSQPSNVPAITKKKKRKRRIVRVVSVSYEDPHIAKKFKESIVDDVNSTSPASSSFSHPIFHTQVRDEQQPDVNNLTPLSHDDRFREIDANMQDMFYSPQHESCELKSKSQTALDTSTSLSLTASLNVSKHNLTIEETICSTKETDQSSAIISNELQNTSSTNTTATTSLNQSGDTTKHVTLGSSQYRFEKVSENVVNLFISRKRKRKRTSQT